MDSDNNHEARNGNKRELSMISLAPLLLVGLAVGLYAAEGEVITGIAAASGTYKRPQLLVDGKRYELKASGKADASVAEMLAKFSQGDTGTGRQLGQKRSRRQQRSPRSAQTRHPRYHRQGAIRGRLVDAIPYRSIWPIQLRAGSITLPLGLWLAAVGRTRSMHCRPSPTRSPSAAP